MRMRIPSMVRCNLPFRIGHQRYLVRFYFQYQVNEFFLAAIAFNIEFGGNDLFYFPYIIIANMALVGTRVHRYAIRAEMLRIDSRFYYIGIVAAATVAQRGEFVDVYAQFGHLQK